MKKTLLIISGLAILSFNSCSDSTPSITSTQYATLKMKVDGRLFTSDKGFGLYSENSAGGTTIKSVAFGHNAEIAEESIALQFGSEVTVGNTLTFGKGTAGAESLNQAIYKKPNTTTSSNAYLVSPLSSTTKCRFTYKVVRIFDNAASTVGKSVEFDFSGVLYKGNNANDSVVITEGTLRY